MWQETREVFKTHSTAIDDLSTGGQDLSGYDTTHGVLKKFFSFVINFDMRGFRLCVNVSLATCLLA